VQNWKKEMTSVVVDPKLLKQRPLINESTANWKTVPRNFESNPAHTFCTIFSHEVFTHLQQSNVSQNHNWQDFWNYKK